LDPTKLLFLFACATAISAVGATSPAWAWGNQGHEIIAIVAADNLLPAAREHVAKILGTASDVDSIEQAMAAVRFGRTPNSE